MTEINKHIAEINKLCGIHHVISLYAFGSVLSNGAKQPNDIDLIVEFAGIDLKNYADNYYSLKEGLQKIFSRPVDLLEKQAIKNPYFREAIEQSKKLVYAA